MGQIKVKPRPKSKKELIGVDVFIDWDEKGRDPKNLGDKLRTIEGTGLFLKLITNRGVMVYPEGVPETFCTDHWRCRFVAGNEGDVISHEQVIEILGKINELGFDFIKSEHLYTFDGEKGYSLGQGE